MRIVGLLDMRQMIRRKDGQPIHAWMVYYTAPTANVIGEEADSQFVDEKTFADALNMAGLTDPSQVIGRECSIAWNRRGFLDTFAISPRAVASK